MNKPVIKVGIRKTSSAYDVWRLSFDGTILGDSRGYSRAQALIEASNYVARTKTWKTPDAEYVLEDKS